MAFEPMAEEEPGSATRAKQPGNTLSPEASAGPKDDQGKPASQAPSDTPSPGPPPSGGPFFGSPAPGLPGGPPPNMQPPPFFPAKGPMPPGGSPWTGPFFDANFGRYYYYNTWTQQSEWAPPMPAMHPPPHYCGPGAYPYYGMPPMMPPQGMLLHGMLPHGLGQCQDPLEDRREHCSDFKRGKCDRGAACKYAHIRPTEECGDFKRGKCNRGSTCKYLHVGDSGRSRSRSR